MGIFSGAKTAILAALAIGAASPLSSPEPTRAAPKRAAPARTKPIGRRLSDADRVAIEKAEAKRARKAGRVAR